MKWAVLEFWKRPDGEVLSTRGDLICLVLFLAAFVSASYDWRSESFRQRKEGKMLFLPSCHRVLPSWPLLLFWFFFSCFKIVEMSQSEVS